MRYPRVLAVVGAVLLAASPAAPQSTSGDTALDAAPRRTVQAYAGLGPAVAPWETVGAFTGGVAFRIGANLWAARGVWTARGALSAQQLWDVGLLYGRVGATERGWVAAGVAVVGGQFEQCPSFDLFGAGSCTEQFLWPTLGLPVEFHLVLFPRHAHGVDLVAFTNVNAKRSFGGLAVALRVGSAGIRREPDAAVLASDSPAPNTAAESTLQPGAPLRVTYCDADCTTPRLTATGGFAGLRHGTLRLGPEARLRVRVRQDGTVRPFDVVELAEAGMWIDTGGRTWVPLRSGWMADADGLSIPVKQATRVEMGVPRPSGVGALRGGLVGGGVGALAFGAWGLANHGFFNPIDAAMVGALMGLVGGAPIGAVMGAIYPGTRWEAAPDLLGGRR